ncbi:MAG TPA: wax ester/triacylglycerol synthase family O-acyltransferase [Jiangellaceae bacterium]
MERLSAMDLSMLWPDEFGWPQDIGALAIMDGSRLLDANGRFRIDAVRAAIDSRLHLVRRFRQVLYVPRRGLGWPLWVDAPAFQLGDHVRVLPLPEPADEAQLLRTVEALRRRRLDRSRPLWEMWFLPGLTDGRVGMFMKMHHAVADGVAGVATLGAFLDAVPDVPVGPAPPWTPVPAPSTRQLFDDNLRRRRDSLRRAFSTISHPVAAARRVRVALPALRETFAEGRAPRTSLNRPIGSDRRLAVIRGSIDRVRDVADAHDATINDVLMTAVAGGLHDLLRDRGEPVDHVVLRAYVPVSLHQGQHGRAEGNLDGMMVIPLPIGVLDPARRLRLIAAETRRRKSKHRPPGGTLLRNSVIQRAFLHVLARQPWANAYVANVPGPPVPLYLAGAPLLEVFPMVPLTGNLTLGVGALSYAGQFNLAAVADRDACPDVEVFAAGVRAALQELGASAPVTTVSGAR